MIEKLLGIFSKWTPMGQGLLLIFLVLVFCGILAGIGKFIVTLVHGYNPYYDEPEDDEKDFDEYNEGLHK